MVRPLPQDNFNVRLRASMAPGGGFSGHGVDKLGHFVMEGSPLLDRGEGETWWVWFRTIPWVVPNIVGTWLLSE